MNWDTVTHLAMKNLGRSGNLSHTSIQTKFALYIITVAKVKHCLSIKNRIRNIFRFKKISKIFGELSDAFLNRLTSIFHYATKFVLNIKYSST